MLEWYVHTLRGLVAPGPCLQAFNPGKRSEVREAGQRIWFCHAIKARSMEQLEGILRLREVQNTFLVRFYYYYYYE